MTPSFGWGSKSLTSSNCWLYGEARLISPLTRICGTQQLFGILFYFFFGGGLLPPPPSVFPGFTSVLPAVSHWVPGYETQGDKWGGCTNNNYVLLKSESQSIVCPRARPSDSSACFSLPFSVCLQTLVVLSTCFNKYFVCCIPINIHREWSTLGFVIF